MRILVGPAVVVALALATGCTYVTQSDLEEKRACIDVDGDGAPQQYGSLSCEADDLGAIGLETVQRDCDETSDVAAERAPHFEEIPYDAIDNDCDENEEDIIDVDGDGYAGITREDYEALGGVWPEGMSDEFDCNDDDDTIHPTSNFELYYDGVDSNCDNRSDYDFDGDGYIPTLNPNTGQPHDPPYTGLLEDGDCDDTDATINPGRLAADDLPYDGVDLNCDCANDFDDDGDGFMWDQATYQVTFNTFETTYNCGLTEQWDDCDDSDEDIYPGATDAWYDGIDSNCDLEDDYDQDRDGFIPDAYAGIYTGALEAGDCLDTDDTIFPGALELIGDTTDQDCNGDLDTSAFAYAEASWTKPRSPEVGWTGNHYAMAVGAQEWTNESTVPAVTQQWPGLLLTFEPGADNQTEFEQTNWNGSATQDPLGEVFDMAVDPVESRVYVAFSMNRTVGTGSNIYLSLRGFQWNSFNYATLAPVLQGVASTDFAEDVDVQIAGTGAIFATSCAVSHLQYAHASWDSGNFARDAVGASSSVSGTACVLDPSPTDNTATLSHVQTASGTDPKPYYLRSSSNIVFEDADPGDLITTNLYENYEFGVVNEQEGVVAFHDLASGNSYVVHPGGTETVFVGVQVWDIKATTHPTTGDLYIVAVTEDQGTDGLDDLVLLYGPAGSLNRVDIPLDSDNATLQPHGAAVHVDDERVFLAVSMRDTDTTDPQDDLGWMFLGFAP